MAIHVSDRSILGEMFVRDASLLAGLKTVELIEVPLLKWVGPWDDTTFNWRQAKAIVVEVDLLIRAASDQSAREELIQLKELAELAAQRHRELVFVGD